MAKKRAVPMADVSGHAVFCPACECAHLFAAPGGVIDDGAEFNGDHEFPTFDSAVIVAGDENHHRCHCAVERGRIRFFDDCSHPFRGMTIDLPEFPG